MTEAERDELKAQIAELEAVLAAVRQGCDDLRAQRTRLTEMIAERDVRLAEAQTKLTDPDYMYAGNRILRESILARNEEREEQRRRAEAAEARADKLHKELNHWKYEFMGSIPKSEIESRIKAYSERIEKAEARAEALIAELSKRNLYIDALERDIVLLLERAKVTDE